MGFRYKHGATVGRYRPYHNGHLFLHYAMLKNCAEITILIGSAQEEDTEKNPFTIEEVREMILNCHPNDIKRIRILTIEDIHNPPKWKEHVLKTIGKPIDAYYCGSEEDASCFINQNEFDVVVIDRVQASKEHDFKSGTEIRKLLYDNNPECMKYVPEINAKFLRRMLRPF